MTSPSVPIYSTNQYTKYRLQTAWSLMRVNDYTIHVLSRTPFLTTPSIRKKKRYAGLDVTLSVVIDAFSNIFVKGIMIIPNYQRFLFCV